MISNELKNIQSNESIIETYDEFIIETYGVKTCCKCGQVKPLNDFTALFSSGNPRYTALCKQCHEATKIRNRISQKKYTPKYRKSIRNQVLNAYGNSCICCGETEPQFLALDHINNDGAAHRKELGMNGGSAFYAWVIRNNFPSNLQLLCHNCNMAKAFYGKCPHSKQSIQMTV